MRQFQIISKSTDVLNNNRFPLISLVKHTSSWYFRHSLSSFHSIHRLIGYIPVEKSKELVLKNSDGVEVRIFHSVIYKIIVRSTG